MPAQPAAVHKLEVRTHGVAERPPLKGLAVPGMPAGAPGMEAPNPAHCQVSTIDADGRTTAFAEH